MTPKNPSRPTADIVVGLGWGDECKGATTDYLAHHHKAKRVVRFNGGQQAAHNVQVGRLSHTFSNYGSGTFSQVPTWISEHCTIDPLSALQEQTALKTVLTTDTRFIHVSELTKVTTPLHVFVNRARERARGAARHGSTGTGFGETVAWEYHGNTPLRARDMSSMDTILDFLQFYGQNMGLAEQEPGTYLAIARTMMDAFNQVFKVVDNDHFLNELTVGHTVFEGAQGFLLDENFGQPPHNTWSTTTPSNARTMLRQAGVKDVTVYGCLRTYATRHGAGPMPYENHVTVPEPHNKTSEWAGVFRTGLWDRNMLEWSIERVKPDYLAISWLDQFPDVMTNKGPVRPDMLGTVAIKSYGPDRSDRLWTV